MAVGEAVGFSRRRITSGGTAASMHIAGAARDSDAAPDRRPLRGAPAARARAWASACRICAAVNELFGSRRVAEADLDLDEAVAPDARAHGERHARMDELEMRDLQPLAAQGDLAVGGERGRPQLDAERRAGFGGRNDDDGSLNPEHGDLLNEHGWLRPSGQIPGAGWFQVARRGRGQVFMWLRGHIAGAAALCHHGDRRWQCTLPVDASEADVAGRLGQHLPVAATATAAPCRGVSAQETPLASQHLTKSRYIAGLQCPRRLWLVVHEPPPYEEPAPGSPMDIGQEIGRKAHLLFPGGVLVTEEPWQHAEAVARTAALMDDARVPAIFEAAFEYDGIRIRVDVMERLAAGAWGLREVKSSSGLKDHYLDDIALQAYVLRGAGITVSSIELAACEHRLCARAGRHLLDGFLRAHGCRRRCRRAACRSAGPPSRACATAWP